MNPNRRWKIATAALVSTTVALGIASIALLALFLSSEARHAAMRDSLDFDARYSRSMDHIEDGMISRSISLQRREYPELDGFEIWTDRMRMAYRMGTLRGRMICLCAMAAMSDDECLDTLDSV